MRRNRNALPRGVWALGFVSLFMDISSEMIHSLLPVFLTTVLGASLSFVGLIEGLGEATAMIVKVLSGWLSDRFGNRKTLAIIGYGLGTLSKPFFAGAPAAGWILGARVGDRVGKGIRGAPRDAMVADLTPPEQRGAAFGLRQSLDTVGAFAGPLLAILLMEIWPGGFRRVFWIAGIPGLFALAILAFAVREPSRQSVRKDDRLVHLAELKKLQPSYWHVVTVGAIFTLARFSEAFLVLRAVGQGLTIALTPLVLIVMNVVYAVAAYPIGALSDRIGRRNLLIPGFAVLLVADIALGLSPGIAVTMLGIALWGLHMGMTQGVLSALVADTCPASLRGTAYGIFNLAGGISVLLASVIAGYLWQTVGPKATFLGGALCIMLGILAMAALSAWSRRNGNQKSAQT